MFGFSSTADNRDEETTTEFLTGPGGRSRTTGALLLGCGMSLIGEACFRPYRQGYQGHRWGMPFSQYLHCTALKKHGNLITQAFSKIRISIHYKHISHSGKTFRTGELIIVFSGINLLLHIRCTQKNKLAKFFAISHIFL